MRVTRVAVAMVLVAAVAGCSGMRGGKPKAMVAREGVLSRGETLQYVGVDFRRTTFFDPYLRYDDAVHGKIPSWSSHAMEEASLKFPMPLSTDFAVVDELNKKVTEKQFVTIAPDPAKWPLTDDVVRKEIAPWVGRKNSGHALLIVAEQLSKPTGVVAHYVVFDRATGEIVLLDQMVGKVGGFGPHNFYLNGLKDVAGHARDTIASLVR
jgi:hypothetical protein